MGVGYCNVDGVGVGYCHVDGVVGGGGGGGPMTTFGDLGNYVNDFNPSPHDF